LVCLIQQDVGGLEYLVLQYAYVPVHVV